MKTNIEKAISAQSIVFLFKIYKNNDLILAQSEVIGFQLCAHYKNNNGDIFSQKYLCTKLMVILSFIKAKKVGKSDKCMGYAVLV
jgi:hypothetical protein